VPTIDTITISSTGTMTLTFSLGFQWIVPGNRSTPSRARTRAPTPSSASTKADASNTFAAVSTQARVAATPRHKGSWEFVTSEGHPGGAG
jgi:hypothetical protein